MARDISARALDCIKSGPTTTTRVTITKPGGDAIAVETSPGWDVQDVGPVAGTRLTIGSMTFLPTVGVDDLYALVSYPGAVVDAAVGITIGATVEYIPVFQGVITTISSRRSRLGVTASLADQWSYLDRIPLSAPFTSKHISRAQNIGNLFSTINLGLSVQVTGDGGDVTHSTTYTDTRGQAASQLASDGMLQVGFDADGDLVIKDQVDIYHPLTPVWVFKSGDTTPQTNFGLTATDYPTIIAGSLERSTSLSDSWINRVVVTPGATWQTWKKQTARLKNTSDPRHESAIGIRETEVQSNTIDNACDALLLAKAVLGRLLRGSAETVKFQVVLNPAVEADDVVYVAASPNAEDTGWANSYIATSVTHSPESATTSIEAVSAAIYSIGQ